VEVVEKNMENMEEAVLNSLFPWNTPFSHACYPIYLVRSCGSRWKKYVPVGVVENNTFAAIINSLDLFG
jgi:hypothetical protein